ncbi:c-type cytochrome [Trinickia sp. EG282A]|uniref:c-type cytochrome n=1 Tax=Trinickia sp. EG282A TaxID=3237013 RepID=UPI0034D24978
MVGVWARRVLAAARVGVLGIVVVAGWPVGASAAAAPAGLDVARSNACLGCHAIDRKLVGPGFAQVAEKYKGDPQAQKRLEAKVRDGGSGVWGVIPMPAHPRMSDADIKTVVQWVLDGAPSK